MLSDTFVEELAQEDPYAAMLRVCEDFALFSAANSDEQAIMLQDDYLDYLHLFVALLGTLDRLPGGLILPPERVKAGIEGVDEVRRFFSGANAYFQKIKADEAYFARRRHFAALLNKGSPTRSQTVT